MTKKAMVTQGQLRRNIRAARQEGLEVVGIQADGTVLVNHGENGLTPVVSIQRDRQAVEAARWGDAG